MRSIEALKSGMLIGVGFLSVVSVAYAAISWPATPSGETAGGKYSAKLVPSGAIMAFNLASCPSGWKAADGTNSTPDLRGEFIRGLDNGRGIDTSRTLASWQKPSLTTGDILSHGMIVGFLGKGSSSNRAGYGWENPGINGYGVSGEFTNGGYGYIPASSTTYDSIDYSTLGTVRPRNIAFLYCIKD